MNTSEDIKKRIRKVLMNDLELNINETDLQSVENLEELFSMDSVAVIEFVLGLEKEFGTEIQPEYLNIEVLKDIPALSLYIYKLLSEKAAKRLKK